MKDSNGDGYELLLELDLFMLMKESKKEVAGLGLFLLGMKLAEMLGLECMGRPGESISVGCCPDCPSKLEKGIFGTNFLHPTTRSPHVMKGRCVQIFY